MIPAPTPAPTIKEVASHREMGWSSSPPPFACGPRRSGVAISCRDRPSSTAAGCPTRHGEQAAAIGHGASAGDGQQWSSARPDQVGLAAPARRAQAATRRHHRVVPATQMQEAKASGMARRRSAAAPQERGRRARGRSGAAPAHRSTMSCQAAALQAATPTAPARRATMTSPAGGRAGAALPKSPSVWRKNCRRGTGKKATTSESSHRARFTRCGFAARREAWRRSARPRAGGAPYPAPTSSGRGARRR
jgi:hypothetical protein